jgi:hypothetical protein
MGNRVKGLHKGKLDGDTIKGTYVMVTYDDQKHTEEWIATRVK